MLFRIKYIIIFLLNKMSAYIAQNTETVSLPAWSPTNTKEISLTLKTFGKQIQLNLRRNDHLTVSATCKARKHDAKSETEKLNASDFCYHHYNDDSSAVMNLFQAYGWEGFVFLKNDTLKITPLRDNFASMTDNFCIKKETNISIGKLHLIKRSTESNRFNPCFNNSNLDNFKLKRHVRDTQKELTIELAVFLDEAAYHTFMRVVNEDKEKLLNMVLAYVNNMQVLFHHSSLGTSIDISLVYLEIMEKQPLGLSVSNNNGIKLLKLFCDYANTRNPSNDNDPGHWDIALYLTGLDIYGYTTDLKLNNYTIGLSITNSICHKTQSCTIIEFGVDRVITSGFSSSLTAVHEIGHMLGMDHDSESCNEREYIMSPFQYNRGQLTWSECSRNRIKHLWNEKQCLRDRTTPKNITNYAYDHYSHYLNLPGSVWNAKAQCEIYFHDKDANVVSLLDICQTLECEKFNQIDFVGAALEGTNCANGKVCRGGECVPIVEPPYIFKYCKHLKLNNWSEWKADSCTKNCLEKSKGVLVKRRFCTRKTNKTANCEGLYYDVVLCNNRLLCADISRLSISDFTQVKCTQFSKLATMRKLPLEILKQPGKQVSHNVNQSWIACTIHCQRKYGNRHGYAKVKYYAPRSEMLKIGIDPYFPDGTWCHHKDGHDYYCRQHYCLPESY